MVARKRLRQGSDSNDSKGQTLSSSPLMRKHDDDFSGTEAMLKRRKQLDTTTTTLFSSPASKMTWSRNDELVILGSIVDYKNETKLSYRSDWDAFYAYIKDFIEADFSKRQLMDKIRNLKKRFTYNQARSKEGEIPSFSNTDDDDIFKLSMIIWATNETEYASDENIDQAKDVPCVEQDRANENMNQEKDLNKDVPCVEHEPVKENVDPEKDDNGVEHERANENMDQENVDVPTTEHEPVSKISTKNDKGDKEKSEEDSMDEICALKDALEATTLFQSSGKYQQKLLLQNLKNLGAQRRKELSDEWKALLAQEMQLYAKKLILSAKLASAGDAS